MEQKNREQHTDEEVQKLEPSSRTQQKKEATRMQALGEQLLEFKITDLDQIPLPDRVRIAITEYKRLPNSHGAKKRQKQYLGKIMRDCSKEEINEAINLLQLPRKTSPQSRILARELTEIILTAGDDGINQILSKHSRLQRQKLRQLFREYSKAAEENRAKCHKKLESYISESLNSKE